MTCLSNVFVRWGTHVDLDRTHKGTSACPGTQGGETSAASNEGRNAHLWGAGGVSRGVGWVFRKKVGGFAE